MPPPARPARRRPGIVEEIGAGPMVSIAANNGQAWGGGAERSWGCDLRIAAESATYGQPEVALGISPGAGGTTRLARLIGSTKWCLEMILDGRPITAREALALGPINRVVPDDRLREEAIAWTARISQWPAWSLGARTGSFREGCDLPIDAARRNEPGRACGGGDGLAKYDAAADSYAAIGPARVQGRPTGDTGRPAARLRTLACVERGAAGVCAGLPARPGGVDFVCP